MTAGLIMALAGTGIFLVLGYLLLKLLKGKGYMIRAVSLLVLLSLVMLGLNLVAPLVSVTPGLVMENARPTMLGMLTLIAVIAGGIIRMRLNRKKTPIEAEQARETREENQPV